MVELSPGAKGKIDERFLPVIRRKIEVADRTTPLLQIGIKELAILVEPGQPLSDLRTQYSLPLSLHVSSRAGKTYVSAKVDTRMTVGHLVDLLEDPKVLHLGRRTPAFRQGMEENGGWLSRN